MTIKDVEKVTGLTAKSIRFYEDKGLINVKRNAENSYRHYTEENVVRLKWIKLFRYLDFSVEQIREMLDEEPEKVSGYLTEKAEDYEEKGMDCTTKRELCITLSRDYKKGEEVLGEYEDTITFWESEDMEELKGEIRGLTTPSFSQVLLLTLIFSGPVLSLFINISSGESDLTLNAVLAILSTVFITLSWRDYLHKYKFNKKRVKEKNSRTKVIFPIMILGIVGVLAVLFGLMTFQERIMAPEGWLFYQYNVYLEGLMIVLIVLPVILVLIWIFKKLFRMNTKEVEDNLLTVTLIKKFPIPVIAIWVIGLYICFSSVTYVTEDSIILHTPLHPLGQTYSYEDVTLVETGFGDKSFSLFEFQRKGNFYYKIWIGNKKVVFSVPSVNGDIKRYENDSYLELEEFDERIVKTGMKKESSDANAAACDLDPEYVERFLRIIKNMR